MKRIVTITSILLLLLAATLGISAFVVTRYIDPNKFKGRISQYVYAKTDQVLVINGNMKWSFFPWIGLKADNLTYYNSPDFTPKTFISAKEMDIKVKLIPLLTGKIEVGTVTLDRAVLNLVKNKSGQYNWQSLTKNEDEKPDNSHSTSNAVAKMTIESLKIKNSRLNWYDQTKNSHTALSNVNISSKDIRFGQPFPLSIEFDLLDDKNTKSLALDLETNLNIAANYQKYDLENIKLKAQYFTSPKTIAIKGEGKVSADTQQQSIDSRFDLGVEDLNLKLNLAGKLKPLNLNGTLSTDEFNLKDLLASFGKPMVTKNNKSLTNVNLLSKITINDSGIQLTRLHAKVDRNDLFGNLAILNQSKTYRFNLTTNNVDIDDFIADDQSSSSDSNKENKAASTKDSWALAGTVKIGQLKADKLTFSNVTASINDKNKMIRIAPFHANFYKGVLDGSVTVDKSNPNRSVTYVKQTAKNIDIKELLHEFSDADKLSGSTDLILDVSSATSGNSSFLSGLNGTMQLTLNKGSMKGMDVIYQLSRAHAFIKRLSSHGLSDSKQTDFASLTASGVINNGVINTDNLTLTSDYLKVNGKGSTNLVTKDIHYRLNALAQPKLAAVNDQIGKEITVYQVPIKVSGKLTKPSVNLDFAELAKTFLTKEIQKPVTEHLQKNINNIKDSLKAKVQEKLKSISPLGFLSKLNPSKEKEEQPEVNNVVASEDAPAETANAQ